MVPRAVGKMMGMSVALALVDNNRQISGKYRLGGDLSKNNERGRGFRRDKIFQIENARVKP